MNSVSKIKQVVTYDYMAFNFNQNTYFIVRLPKKWNQSAAHAWPWEAAMKIVTGNLNSIVILCVTFALIACSGGGGGGSSSGTPGGGKRASGPFTIGGKLSGASGPITLQNNYGDDLTVNKNGEFTFATALGDNESYLITIATLPVGQTCTASKVSGVTAGANIANVNVNCQTPLPPPVAGSSGSLDTAGFGDQGKVVTDFSGPVTSTAQSTLSYTPQTLVVR